MSSGHFGEGFCIDASFSVIEMRNQNFILIKDEKVMSLRDWTCDKEEESNEDEGETDMSHAKEKSVLELKETELTTRIIQGVEGQLLNVVREEEERYAGIRVISV